MRLTAAACCELAQDLHPQQIVLPRDLLGQARRGRAGAAEWSTARRTMAIARVACVHVHERHQLRGHDHEGAHHVVVFVLEDVAVVHVAAAEDLEADKDVDDLVEPSTEEDRDGTGASPSRAAQPAGSAR